MLGSIDRDTANTLLQLVFDCAGVFPPVGLNTTSMRMRDLALCALPIPTYGSHEIRTAAEQQQKLGIAQRGRVADVKDIA